MAQVSRCVPALLSRWHERVLSTPLGLAGPALRGGLCATLFQIGFRPIESGEHLRAHGRCAHRGRRVFFWQACSKAARTSPVRLSVEVLPGLLPFLFGRGPVIPVWSGRRDGRGTLGCGRSRVLEHRSRSRRIPEVPGCLGWSPGLAVVRACLVRRETGQSRA